MLDLKYLSSGFNYTFDPLCGYITYKNSPYYYSKIHQILSVNYWTNVLAWNLEAREQNTSRTVLCPYMDFYNVPDFEDVRSRLCRLVQATPFLKWCFFTVNSPISKCISVFLHKYDLLSLNNVYVGTTIRSYSGGIDFVSSIVTYQLSNVFAFNLMSSNIFDHYDSDYLKYISWSLFGVIEDSKCDPTIIDIHTSLCRENSIKMMFTGWGEWLPGIIKNDNIYFMNGLDLVRDKNLFLAKDKILIDNTMHKSTGYVYWKLGRNLTGNRVIKYSDINRSI